MSKFKFYVDIIMIAMLLAICSVIVIDLILNITENMLLNVVALALAIYQLMFRNQVFPELIERWKNE